MRSQEVFQVLIVVRIQLLVGRLGICSPNWRGTREW